MKLSLSFLSTILTLVLLTGCYGSPAFEGDLDIKKEGQEDIGSQEPCVGQYGKAKLYWSDTQTQVPTLTKYTIKYGVKSGVYTNLIDLPPTGGVDYTDQDTGKNMQRFEYLLENLDRGYTYYFIMTASNPAGESIPSQEVFKTIDICPTTNEDFEVHF